jgi:TFIIF-interacting CTD phosphatase-like protein
MQPKTLVLDLKGTLLSSEYIFGQGFVIMKRPGLTEFLNKVSQMYEVVIFCEEETMFMSQLVESLDPNHRIFQARMGKECLSYRGGELTKDMRFLNRDMKNLIIIEKNPKMVKLHSDNVILLPEFQGNENDRALIEILPFLEHLVKDKIPDVRKEIERYGHVDTGKKYLGRLEKIIY